MDTPTRSRTPLFLAGLLVGAAVATAASFALRPAAKDEQAERTQPAAQAASVPVRVDCPSSAVVAAAGAADGKASFDGSSNAARSIVGGKEAAAGGRDRDAEAAFLAACKVPVAAGDEKATLLRADAMYNLGRHYASLAEEGAPNSKELLQRASVLLQHGLAVYQSHLGQSDEKVKFALQAIAAIRESVPAPAATRERVVTASRPEPPEASKASQAPARAAPSPAETRSAAPAATPAAPAPAAAPPRATASVAAAGPATPPAPAKPVKPAAKPAVAARPAPEPEPEPPSARNRTDAARARPSFDCSKARSTPERLICSDDELARQDSELSRIYARAKREADDPAAFQRVSDREWRRREAECRTRECVLDWYAQRRRQLLEPR